MTASDDDTSSAGREWFRHAVAIQESPTRMTQVVSMVVAVAGVIFLILSYLLEFDLSRSWSITLGAVAAVSGAVSVALTSRENAVKRLELSASRMDASVSLREAEKQIVTERDQDSDAEITFSKLWFATQLRIDFYHEIATNQSKQSFRNGQIAAYTGFLVVILVALAAVLTTSETGAIAAGVVGVAGAGLSGYIGSTFMKAQSEASSQLREYFLQPVEFSRLLGAERLVKTIDDPAERSQAVQEIVNGMVPRK